MAIKFDGNDPIAGYDPDEFVQLTLVGRGQDPKDDRCFRSHLGRIVTKRLDKIIRTSLRQRPPRRRRDRGPEEHEPRVGQQRLPLALQPAAASRWSAFIPAVVSHPIIRKKCVLHIMDGSRGRLGGGAVRQEPKWLWDYNALLFATDPVAMDHVEWDILDARRKEMRVPGVGAVGRSPPTRSSTRGYDIRQPQYIAMAGQVGLGNFDYKSPTGRRFSIDHRVLNVT